VLTDVHIELVFWGTGWNAPNIKTPESTIEFDVNALFSTNFLSALTQYRSNIATTGELTGEVTITSTSPAARINQSDVVAMLQANFAANALPLPASDPDLVYIVIPQPGTTTSGFGEQGNVPSRERHRPTLRVRMDDQRQHARHHHRHILSRDGGIDVGPQHAVRNHLCE